MIVENEVIIAIAGMIGILISPILVSFAKSQSFYILNKFFNIINKCRHSDKNYCS